ncbi:hypothetical protein D3C80_1583330 [compost metagenome]
MIAFPLGAGAQRGQIGAGAGLRKTLAPQTLAVEHRRQMLGLLLRRGKGIEHRPEHLVHEAILGGCTGQAALVIEHQDLRYRPARAAVFLGPVRRSPAALVEELLPAHDLLARRAGAALLPFQVRRDLVPKELTDLFAERLKAGIRSKIHGVSPVSLYGTG